MHILITGVAGFIGSRVADLLLADGNSVTGIDNLSDTYDVRLKLWRLAQLQGRRDFAFHCLDVCHLEELRGLFDSSSQRRRPRFDAIVHLAARAGVRQSTKDPWGYFESNVTGTLNLLELCRSHGPQKFVLASSSSLYGAANSVPYREDADTNHPISPYAASKKAAETLCYSYHHLYGLDITVLRYFTVYGPAGRPDMMPFRFVQWISEERPVIVFGDGKQSRDLTYVEDVARGTISGLKPMGYQVINLGSDRPIVLQQAIQVIEDLVGKRALLEFRSPDPTDVRSTWADIGMAKRLLCWQPHCSFQDGMAQTVDWYQQNQKWTSQIETI